MRLTLAAAALVVAQGCCAQVTDPYGPQVRDSDRKALAYLKENALEHITGLYFAFGCKVFASEGQFAALKQRYYMAGHSAMIEYRVLDLHWPEKVENAAKEGVKRSNEDGCDYWYNNIDLVSDLRRQALQAIR